jgi:hypothetical protein
MDESNSDHILPITEIKRDDLRSICPKFLKPNIKNASDVSLMINIIKFEREKVKKLKVLAKSQKDLDSSNRNRILFRIISCLFSIKDLRDGFEHLNVGHTRFIMEHKVIAAFYENLCNHVKDNNLACNKTLLPCDEVMHVTRYKEVLNGKEMLPQHPSKPVIEVTDAIFCTHLRMLLALQNIIQKMMTQSGNHASDVFKFTPAALSEGTSVQKCSKEALYFFYMQCRTNHAIMNGFSASLPPGIAGSNAVVRGTSTQKKKESDDATIGWELIQTLELSLTENVRRRIESDKGLVVQMSRSTVNRQLIGFRCQFPKSGKWKLKYMTVMNAVHPKCEEQDEGFH